MCNFDYTEQFLVNLIFLYSINRKCDFTGKNDVKINSFIKEKMKNFYSLVHQYKLEINKNKLRALSAINIYLSELHMIWKWFQINVFNNRLNITFNKNLVVISIVAFLDSLFEKISKNKDKCVQNINGNIFSMNQKSKEKRAETLYEFHSFGDKDKFLEITKKMFIFRNKSSINHNDTKNNIKYINDDEIIILYDWIKSLINKK